LSTAAAWAEIERLERFFTVLRDTPAVYPAWKQLVKDHRVGGKPAHDAKLVAAMQVHRLTSILTFDKAGFSRYPAIQIFDPIEFVRG